MSDAREIPDETLDSIVSAASASRSKSVDEPDDEEVMRYVVGDLDDDASTRIRTNLLDSAELRRRVADAVRLISDLRDPETLARFARVEIPDPPTLSVLARTRAPRRSHPDPTAALRADRRSLALAFLLPILILGYPAFRYFTSGSGPGSADVVVAATTVRLVSSDGPGGSDAARTMPVVRLERSRRVLHVVIPLAPPSFAAYDVALSGPGGMREELVALRQDAAEGSFLSVLLDARSAPRGVWEVRIAPQSRDAAPRTFSLTILGE